MAVPLINIQDVRDLLDLSDNVTEQKYHRRTSQKRQERMTVGNPTTSESHDAQEMR